MKKWLLPLLLVVVFVSIAVLAQVQGTASMSPIQRWAAEGKITLNPNGGLSIHGGSFTKEMQDVLFPKPPPKNYTVWSDVVSAYPTFAVKGDVKPIPAAAPAPPTPSQSVASFGGAISRWWDGLWEGAQPNWGRIASYVLFDWWLGGARATGCGTGAGTCFGIGGAFTWNGSSGAHWSDSTGGAACSCVPNGDTVTFDSNSGGGTVTLGVGVLTNGLTIGGTTTLNTSASNFSITTNGTLTVASGGTLTANASAISINGSWDSSAGTFNIGTATVTMNNSANFKTTSSTGGATVYSLTAGNTLTLQSSIGVNGVLTVNGTLQDDGTGRTVWLRDAGGTGAALVLGGSGAVTATALHRINLAYFIQAAGSGVQSIAAGAYTNTDFEFTPAVTVAGDGYEFRAAGNITAAADLFMVQRTSDPFFFNSQTFNMAFGSIIDNSGGAAGVAYGIKATSGTWTLTSNFSISNANSTAFYVQYGSTTWQIGNTYFNVSTNSAKWQIGTSTVTFKQSSTATLTDTYGNVGDEFYNLTLDQNSASVNAVRNIAGHAVLVANNLVIRNSSGSSSDQMLLQDTTNNLGVSVGGALTIGSWGKITTGTAALTVGTSSTPGSTVVLTMNANSTLTVGSGGVTSWGGVSASAGTLNAGTSTLTFPVTGAAQPITMGATGNFYNVTVSGTQEIIQNSAVTVGNNLSVTSTGAWGTGANQSLSVGGSLSVPSGGGLLLAASAVSVTGNFSLGNAASYMLCGTQSPSAGCALTVGGSWTNVSTATANWYVNAASVATFNSATSQSMEFAGTALGLAEFANVTFDTTATTAVTYTMSTNALWTSGTVTIQDTKSGATGPVKLDTSASNLAITAGAMATGALAGVTLRASAITLAGSVTVNNTANWGYNTASFEFTANATITAPASNGFGEFRTVTVDLGVTVTTAQAIGIDGVLTVNGTLTIGGTIWLRNVAATTQSLVLGGSGSVGASSLQTIYYFSQAGSLEQIPAATYTNIHFELSPAVTVAGDGYEYRALGAITATGNLYLAPRTSDPFFFNSQTFGMSFANVLDVFVGATNFGIKVTSGTWSISGNVSVSNAGDTGFFVQFGSSTWNVGNNWFNVSTNAASWQVGTSTVNLVIPSGGGTITQTFATNLGAAEFYNINFQPTSVSSVNFRLGGALWASNACTMSDASASLTVNTMDTLSNVWNVTCGSITVGSGSTFTMNSATVTANGNWASTAGTVSFGTSTLVLGASGSVTTPNSGGAATFYSVTVNVGVTTTMQSSIGVSNVLTVNGSLGFSGTWTVFIRNDLGSQDPLVMGGSGSITGYSGLSQLEFFTQAGAIIDLPGGTFTDMQLWLTPANTVAGFGVHFQFTGDATYNDLAFIQRANAPFYVDSATHNITLNGTTGKCLYDAPVGASKIGIVATSGSWAISCAGNSVSFTSANSSGFYIQFGSSTWSATGPVNFSASTNSTDWQAGSGTFDFNTVNSATGFTPANFSADIFYDVIFESSYVSNTTFTILTHGFSVANDLTVQDSSAHTTLSLGANNLTVGGNISVTAGGGFNMGSATITLAGSWDTSAVTAFSWITPGTSTVVLTGTGVTYIVKDLSGGGTANATFYNLTIQAGATVTGTNITDVTINNVFDIEGSWTTRTEHTFLSVSVSGTSTPFVVGPGATLATTIRGNDVYFFPHSGTTISVPIVNSPQLGLSFSPFVSIPYPGFVFDFTGNMNMEKIDVRPRYSGSLSNPTLYDFVINTYTYDVTLLDTISQNPCCHTLAFYQALGETDLPYGIVSQSGAWSMSNGVAFNPAPFTQFYWKMGAITVNLQGAWINTSSSPNWDAGTSTVNFNGVAGFSYYLSPGNLPQGEFYNVNFGTNAKYTVGQAPYIQQYPFVNDTVMVNHDWDAHLGTNVFTAATLQLQGSGSLNAGPAYFAGITVASGASYTVSGSLLFVQLSLNGVLNIGGVDAGGGGKAIVLAASSGSYATLSSWDVWAPSGPNIGFPIHLSASSATLTITVTNIPGALGVYVNGVFLSRAVVSGANQTMTVPGPWSTQDITITSPPGTGGGGGGGGGSGNPPQIAIIATPGSDGMTYTFTIQLPSGYYPTSFSWDFGDGSTGTGSTVTHTFPASGTTYTVKAQVTFSTGYSAPATTTVTPMGVAQGAQDWLPLVLVLAALLALLAVFVAEEEGRRLFWSGASLGLFWITIADVAVQDFPVQVPRATFLWLPLAVAGTAALMALRKENSRKIVWVAVAVVAVAVWAVTVGVGAI